MRTPQETSDEHQKAMKDSGIVQAFLRRLLYEALSGALRDETEVPIESVIRESFMVQTGIPHLEEATQERNIISPLLQCGVE
jgi:hypothetical protein